MAKVGFTNHHEEKKLAEMSLCLKFVFWGVQMWNASVVVKLSMAQVQNKDQRREHK